MDEQRFSPAPRAEQVAEYLRRGPLSSLAPGEALASVRTLAGALGVSVPTVRAAQRVLARQGLVEIRHGSGVYVTAESGAPRWVGIYTPFDILQPRTSSFHTAVPRLLRDFLRARGLLADIYIGTTGADTSEQHPNNERFLADLAAGRLAGVAILNAPDTSGWQEWIKTVTVPAVGAHTPYRVNTGYPELVRQSVRHLYACGCRRLGLLAWHEDGLESAFCAASAEVGLTVRPAWCRHDLHPMLSGAGWEEFREIWTAAPEKPDGLLVADDVLFDEAQTAILELGIRVPEQLRIVTHANKGVSKRYPFPLTLAQIDPQRYAEELGGMLLRCIRGEPVVPPTAQIPFELVEATPVAGAIGSRVLPHAAILAAGQHSTGVGSSRRETHGARGEAR